MGSLIWKRNLGVHKVCALHDYIIVDGILSPTLGFNYRGLNFQVLALPLCFWNFEEEEKSIMASETINAIHVLSIDGTGEQVLNGMYKEMTVDRLKRTITVLNRRSANTWESLQLYHLGNEMHNGETY